MSRNGSDMDQSPWTITSKKRKSTPSVNFSGRKRQRRDETPSFTRRQQTLTQAQWVSRPSSFAEDADLAPITPAPLSSKGRKSTKKNSTLTQMDFFGTNMPTGSEDDGMSALLEQPADMAGPVAQVDGSWESPRRQRKRKAAPVLKTESTDSQDYQPTQSTKIVENNSNGAGKAPRRSTRQSVHRSKIISDPADNLDYFNQALYTGNSLSDRKNMPIEIQNSVEEEQELVIPDAPPPPEYQTPRGHRTTDTVVKSSQSPESFPPSVHRSGRDAIEQQGRSVLSPISANLTTPIPFTGLPPAMYGKENGGQEPRSRLKRRKNQPVSKIDDSQVNLWSVPPTSSLDREVSAGTVPSLRPSTQMSDDRLSASNQDPIEIPSTSQIDENIQGDEISHSQDNNVPIQEHDSAQHAGAQERVNADDQSEEASELPAPNTTDKADTRDSASTAQSRAESDARAMPPPSTPKAVRFEVVEDSEAEDSDFGSPIMNDTQYNVDVEQRTSSPAAPETHSPTRPRSSHTPIPTPRLVRHSSPRQAMEIESYSSSDGVSLPPPPPPTAIPNSIIRRIPLNDTLPSSSPPVQSTKSATQRSVHPASMPHPSQISTQEATQSYMESSFMPFETPRATQRITIKDSSSARLPMSQIPPQPSQSQLNVDLGLDAFGVGSDDYDLDPLNSAPVQQQAVEARSKTLPQDEIPTERIVPSSQTSSPRPTKQHESAVSATAVQSTARTPKSKGAGESTVVTRHSPADAGRTHVDGDEVEEEGDEQPNATPDEPAIAHKGKQPQRSASPVRTDESPLVSSPQAPPLARAIEDYTQLPGFNNETQSNFTQGGHVSAAYVHRQREAGVLPKWYTPKPYKVPGYTRR